MLALFRRNFELKHFAIIWAHTNSWETYSSSFQSPTASSMYCHHNLKSALCKWDYIRLFTSQAGDGLGKVVYVRHIRFVKVGNIYWTEIWISVNATSVKYIINLNSMFCFYCKISRIFVGRRHINMVINDTFRTKKPSIGSVYGVYAKPPLLT